LAVRFATRDEEASLSAPVPGGGTPGGPGSTSGSLPATRVDELLVPPGELATHAIASPYDDALLRFPRSYVISNDTPSVRPGVSAALLTSQCLYLKLPSAPPASPNRPMARYYIRLTSDPIETALTPRTSQLFDTGTTNPQRSYYPYYLKLDPALTAGTFLFLILLDGYRPYLDRQSTGASVIPGPL